MTAPTEALRLARDALQEARDYMNSNPPANGYGLLDHAADKDRCEALKKVVAAIDALPQPSAPSAEPAAWRLRGGQQVESAEAFAQPYNWGDKSLWEPLYRAPAPAPAPSAVVYPPDGTVSPFTVINLGTGRVQMGDSIHDGRLPALWFGKNGQGMGHEEVLNRQAHEGETLAVVTFANVEGLDVLLDVIQRIRRVSFPGAAS